MNPKDNYPEFDEFNFVVEENGEVTLWGYGEYPQSSVLAGGYRQQWLERFVSIDEATLNYPDVGFTESSPIPFKPIMSDVPPSDFDPMDAGEVWHEDDY